MFLRRIFALIEVLSYMSKKRTFLYGFTIALGVLGWMFVYACSSTVLGGWYLSAIAAIIALLFVMPMARWWQKFTHLKSMLLNALIAVAVGGGIISAVLIGLNFIDLPGTEPVYYRCKVEKSYRTEHHRSRRVGRRYVSTGETYYRYHADISLPDGKQVTVPITAGRYRTARANDSITIAVHKGMMGVDYITPKFKSKL